MRLIDRGLRRVRRTRPPDGATVRPVESVRRPPSSGLTEVSRRPLAGGARVARDVVRSAARLAAIVVAAAALPSFAGGLPADGRALTAAEQQEVLAHIEGVGRRGFLYEVSRPEAPGSPPAQKLFVYGTIHLGREGSEPFNGPLLQALRQSRRLALEADPSDVANVQALAMRLGRYPADDGLQRHLPAALMARVHAFGERAGLTAERIDRLKPWLLANMVALTELSGAGLDAALGSELYLSGFARGLQMPIVEVEGLEAQLRLLSSLPEAMQTAQLDEALSDVDRVEAREQNQALFDLWLDGDVDAGETLIVALHADAGDKPFERYFVDTLIDQRNRTMADVAERYLERPGNTLFAIGSLHLFGDAGLLREFARRGYRVVDLQPPLAATR